MESAVEPGMSITLGILRSHVPYESSRRSAVLRVCFSLRHMPAAMT